VAERQNGVVAAGDPQTANAGATLLRAGGNAIDAAVASAFAAFVCEMPLCSPLGGGVLLVHRAGDAPRAFDMFARTPGLGGGATSSLEFEGVEVSFGAATQVFHVGRGSAAVPLALPGLLDLHRRLGARPLAEVVAPAVRLGKEGFVLGPGVAFVFEVLEPIARRTNECWALYCSPTDPTRLARTGERLLNRDLGTTLEDIGRSGEEGWRAIASELATAFGPSEGGLISEHDLASAKVTEDDPLHTVHRGWEVLTMPGPSTGGVLVALGARLLEGVDALPFLSQAHVLRVARVQEALLAERARDGTCSFDERCRDRREVRAILDEERINELKKEIASGAPLHGCENRLGSTTHISVIDSEGSAVALTLTNGEGCGHVLPGTGMVVNNLLGEEDLHPRGFHRDAPGTALTTMMAPTLLARGDDRIALGSGGSNRLRTAILHVLSGIVDHGLDPERAVVAPRIHLERSRLAFERAGLAADVVAALVAAYPNAPAVFAAPNLYFGGVHVALRSAGVFSGIGDPRRGGAVAFA
jgi:gamma-glutamyltranspeptidase / glutathione hydrolase